MNLKEQARQWIQSVVASHLGKNIRTFKWSTYTGEISHNSLGGVNYLSPADGKVVEQGDVFTLIKTGPSTFTIVKTDLLSQEVDVGDNVGITFYKLRRFDGSAADGTDDPSIGGARTFALTGAQTRFPVKWDDRYLGIDDRFEEQYAAIQNPYLRDLITQLEGLAVDGGLRRVANVLIDAGAKNLAFVDPLEEHSCQTPPAILVDVESGKFKGKVKISYDRASDTYNIDLVAANGEETKRLEDVHFNELGDHLIEAIDDRAWLKAKVTIKKKAPKKKAQPELV